MKFDKLSEKISKVRSIGSAEFQDGIDLIIYLHKSSILSMFTEPASLVIYRETFVSSIEVAFPLTIRSLQQAGKISLTRKMVSLAGQGTGRDF